MTDFCLKFQEYILLFCIETALLVSGYFMIISLNAPEQHQTQIYKYLHLLMTGINSSLSTSQIQYSGRVLLLFSSIKLPQLSLITLILYFYTAATACFTVRIILHIVVYSQSHSKNSYGPRLNIYNSFLTIMAENPSISHLK